MNPRRAPILTFLRDLALSLPAFYERKQRALVNGDFVPVPVDGLRPRALTLIRGGATSVTIRPRGCGAPARVMVAGRRSLGATSSDHC